MRGLDVAAHGPGRSPACARDVPGGQGPGPPSRCWASWTDSRVPVIRMPTPRRAPRMPAATMPRWRRCSARPWASLDARALRASRRPRRLLRGARGGGRRSRVAREPGQGGAARAAGRQGGAAAARPLRRRGPGHDDPPHAARGGRQGRPALSNNGRVGKLARYVGRAAHAGGAPHLGINALYAASIGLMAASTRSARRSATRTPSASTRSSPRAAPR